MFRLMAGQICFDLVRIVPCKAGKSCTMCQAMARFEARGRFVLVRFFPWWRLDLFRADERMAGAADGSVM